MKNYFKKFSIMFVMSLTLVLGSCISAFATDDYEIGTSNLNDTIENSAEQGDILEHPEKGWTRYDDSREELNCNGSVYKGNETSRALCYNKTYTEIYKEGSNITFNFTGNKIRIISDFWPARSENILVKLDGKDYRYNSHSDIAKNQCIFFEKLDLENKEHTVKIVIDSQASISSDGYRAVDIDAIDIDSSGKLRSYNEIVESITLDKSLMNLKVGDTQQLTATTPAPVGVKWTISDSSIATIEVDPTSGKIIKVNALKEGTCIITATTTDGSNLSASCTVNITTKDETKPDNPTNSNDKTGAMLIINLTDGETKVFDVSSSEIDKFKEWYNTKSEFQNKLTYEFDKTVNSSISVEEDVVHDQITSYEIRKY